MLSTGQVIVVNCILKMLSKKICQAQCYGAAEIAVDETGAADDADEGRGKGASRSTKASISRRRFS